MTQCAVLVQPLLVVCSSATFTLLRWHPWKAAAIFLGTGTLPGGGHHAVCVTCVAAGMVQKLVMLQHRVCHWHKTCWQVRNYALLPLFLQGCTEGMHNLLMPLTLTMPLVGTICSWHIVHERSISSQGRNCLVRSVLVGPC